MGCVEENIKGGVRVQAIQPDLATSRTSSESESDKRVHHNDGKNQKAAVSRIRKRD